MSPYNFSRLLQKITKRNWRSLVKRLVISGVSVFLLFLLLNILFPLPDRIAYSTIITNEKGELLNAYLTPDGKWRMKTELGEISPLLRKTIVAKEDRYFYSHPGVNFFAVGRAAVSNLLHLRRTSGASTITMQVARALERRPRTFWTKIIESFRAFQLEWKYDKDEILQLYLNLVPYGGNIEGVKAASLLYFRKNPDHLSLAEITALSIIPNRPSSLVIGKNNDRIIIERNRWLQAFAKEEVFTEKEIEDALAEPLNAYRSSVPHYLPHLSYQLKRRASAVSVATTIDLNTQLKLEKLTEDYVRALKLINIRNAAVIVIDNRTHKVVAYLGSAGFQDTTDGGQVNGAAAIRQPGSTLKPLLYGLAMDEGIFTPKSMIADVAVNYAGYAPENYDRQFNGQVTLERALEQSLNIPAVKALHAVGVERMTGVLTEANFRQIEKDRKKLGLSLALGGCGASLEELTGLFSAFANEGLYVPPVYMKGDSVRSGTRILSRESSYLITEILSKVSRPDFPLNWSATEHMPKIAWKTGTSYGRRDAWSIGYNRNFTVGVWVGNFSALGVPELSGANTATPLLFKIFNTIDYDSDSEWYAPPKELDQRQVCTESGLPPGPNCTNLALDYFIPLVSSTRTCKHLKEWKISADGRTSYCESCAPESGFVRKLYRDVSPEMEIYFAERGIAYEAVPPHNPDCEKIFKGNGPAITSPRNGTEYLLDRTDPEPIQLSARTGNEVGQVYWYINDQFFKSARASEPVFFVPSEGPVKISCTDDKGRNRDIWIRVKYVRL